MRHYEVLLAQCFSRGAGNASSPRDGRRTEWYDAWRKGFGRRPTPKVTGEGCAFVAEGKVESEVPSFGLECKKSRQKRKKGKLESFPKDQSVKARESG